MFNIYQCHGIPGVCIFKIPPPNKNLREGVKFAKGTTDLELKVRFFWESSSWVWNHKEYKFEVEYTSFGIITYQLASRLGDNVKRQIYTTKEFWETLGLAHWRVSVILTGIENGGKLVWIPLQFAESRSVQIFSRVVLHTAPRACTEKTNILLMCQTANE